MLAAILMRGCENDPYGSEDIPRGSLLREIGVMG